MSWQELYNQKLIITLTKLVGGQKQTKDFAVLTRPVYEKTVEWNGTEYAFVNINGVFVKKRKLLKREIPVDFYFVGENNIRDSEEFESWCMSEFPWLMTHPYYGSILCQVLQLKFNSTELNVTQITGTAVETIDEETSAFISKDPKKKVDNAVSEISFIYSTPAYTDNFEPTINDKEVLKEDVNKFYTAFSKITDIVTEVNEYTNLIRDFYTDIDQSLELVSFAVQSLNSLLIFPFTFTASVEGRLRALSIQFGQLRTNLTSYFTVSRKTTYEVMGAGFLQAACLSALNPAERDYLLSTSVLQVIKDIKSLKQNYDSDISQLQSPNGSNPDFYVPNSQLITTIDLIVSTTVSNLYSIALGAKKEFEVIATSDTNVVLLAHRYYGLASEENINKIVDTNNFTYRQIGLGIVAGTKVVYYK